MGGREEQELSVTSLADQVNTGEDACVPCPKCEAPQRARPVTVLRPGDESVPLLFKGELNRVTCDSCEAAFLLDVPILFRDDAERCLIYFLPLEDTRRWAEAERRMADLTDQLFPAADHLRAPRCRLTLTRKSFVEKISLHLDRRDDRLVEYIKYQLYNNPHQKIDPVRSELLYDFSSQDREKLAFILFDRESGRATAGAHIPMEVYDELAESFLPESTLDEELSALFPGYYVDVERLL